MRRFAALLDGLIYTPSRNAKLRLLLDYFRSVPDPDRGWALAALAGRLDLTNAKPALVRALVQERVDPQLFAWSYDYVGDLAETVALIWPERAGRNSPEPSLNEVVETLSASSRREVPGLLETWLDGLDASARWALLKLITGGLRVGVSARLAKTAIAELGGKPVSEIEELWHGLEPPYSDLFAWLEGRAEAPAFDPTKAFRPLMLAHPLEEPDLEKLDLEAFQVEWKWDGIRVQLVAAEGQARLFSRSGDDITEAFPDLVEAMTFDAVIDGELLVARPSNDTMEARDLKIAPFNDLQKRLNRKRVTAKMLKEHPAHLRAYDLLFLGDEDLRALPLSARRQHLEDWFEAVQPARLDLSEVLSLESKEAMMALRESARAQSIEGLMLKRKDASYHSGRPKGLWYKWKRDPLLVDAVLMYAQRGHGKRSSLYSDYTFGVWREGAEGAPELVPIGKAYSGFTDAELKKLDKWVRDNTVERYGPVRAVRYGLVLEVAFDAAQSSNRHKSGIALRFPRVHRIRWDKPHEEADRLESVERLLEV